MPNTPSTASPTVGAAPKLLDRVRDAIRVRHYSLRTEQAYTRWVRKFILFHGKRHPREMGAPEITDFLPTWRRRTTWRRPRRIRRWRRCCSIARMLEIEAAWVDEVRHLKMLRQEMNHAKRIELTDEDWRADFDTVRMDQMLRFRDWPLRDKVQAMEDMAKIVRAAQAARARATQDHKTD